MGHVGSPLGLRERNKLEKRARICEAAGRLFAERGFEATTIEQIAQEAHVAKGTVFLYAKTKHELLFLVFESAIGSAYEQAFNSLPDGAVVDRLVHLFAGFFDFYGRHPALSKIMIKEVLFLEGGERDAYQILTVGFFSRLAEVMQQGIWAGELREDLDGFLAAQLLFGAYVLVLIPWLDEPTPVAVTAQAQLRQSFQLLIAGFRAS